MAGFLPNINKQASARGLDAVATLDPVVYPRKLSGLTVTGPVGSRCDIYLGAISPSSRFDQTSRGQSNSADYPSPRMIPPNTPVLVVWSNQATKAGTCQATFTLVEA